MTQKAGKIWVFDENKLDHAIEKYRHSALEAYPQQQQRIDITVLAIRDFLHSEFAEKLTMNVSLTDSPRHD